LGDGACARESLQHFTSAALVRVGAEADDDRLDSSGTQELDLRHRRVCVETPSPPHVDATAVAPTRLASALRRALHEVVRVVRVAVGEPIGQEQQEVVPEVSGLQLRQRRKERERRTRWCSTGSLERLDRGVHLHRDAAVRLASARFPSIRS
jgi:hypothetical protein